MKQMLPFVLIAALAATACGRKDDEGGDAPAAAPSNDATQAPAGVRACKAVTPSAPSLALQGGVTYSGDLFPIMQQSCAQCHRGDIENRQNSTNCFYMKDHIDNLIRRLDNAVDAAAFRAANPAATDDEIRARYANDERPMPPIGGNRAPLAAAQIDLFRAWARAPNKCEEGSPAPETAEIPAPTDYSSDADDHQSFEKLFATASCEDGPAINDDANWALVAPLLQKEADAPSAFYDYSTQSYIEGATDAQLEACDFDPFLASLGGIAGVEEALRPYQKYGWRMTQCAVVDGLPIASIVTLSRTTNTLGDKIIGLNYKTITIKAAQ